MALDPEEVALDPEEEPAEPVSGGMDEFLSGAAPRAKKMKKVLVEKSFMDDKGYFVTQNVWEDQEVPDDEVAPAPAPKPTKAPDSAPRKTGKAVIAAKKKGGKQGSMMSFFGKK